MNTLKNTTALLLILLLQSCASTLSPKASQIIDSDEKMVSNCKFLGNFHGSSTATGMFSGTGIENAKKEVLNKAAQKGATNIVWGVQHRSYWNNPEATGRGYLCK